MVRSRNKYSRARIRSRVRKPRRRGGSQWFYGALGIIVAAGVVGIVAARPGSSLGPHPRPTLANQVGDHWHSAFGVNICGDWLSNPPEFKTVHDNPGVYAGLHTHDDGFIHVEPQSLSESGNNATIGKFLGYGGWSASSSGLTVWEGPSTASSKTKWSDGATCPAGTPAAGKKGHFAWSVNCRARHDDPNGYKVQDKQVIALAFLPEGEAIGVPPSASGAPSGETGNALKAFNVTSCLALSSGTTTTSTTGAATTDTTTGTTSTTSTTTKP